METRWRIYVGCSVYELDKLLYFCLLKYTYNAHIYWINFVMD